MDRDVDQIRSAIVETISSDRGRTSRISSDAGRVFLFLVGVTQRNRPSPTLAKEFSS